MDKRSRRQLTVIFFLLFVAMALVGLPMEHREWLVGNSSAQKKSEPGKAPPAKATPGKATVVADKKTELDHPAGTTPNPATTKPSTAPPEEMGMAERSPAAYDSTWDRDYPQDQRKKLMAFPDLRPGDIPPVKLYLYGGGGRSSYASIDDVADFKEFYE